MTSQEILLKKAAFPLPARLARTVLPSHAAPVGKNNHPHGTRATRQVHFDYSPSPCAKLHEGIVARADQWRLQHPIRSLLAGRPLTDFHDAAGVLSKLDRFLLDHAVCALEDLQRACLAGGTVIHLSTTSLLDPLLPVYVSSLLERRGIRLRGVSVTLASIQKHRSFGKCRRHQKVRNRTLVNQGLTAYREA